MAMLGLALIAGILTRTAAMITTLTAIGMHASPYTSALFAATSLSLALIGPGGYSVDARLFGFRKIVIPRRGRPNTKHPTANPAAQGLCTDFPPDGRRHLDVEGK